MDSRYVPILGCIHSVYKTLPFVPNSYSSYKEVALISERKIPLVYLIPSKFQEMKFFPVSYTHLDVYKRQIDTYPK